MKSYIECKGSIRPSDTCLHCKIAQYYDGNEKSKLILIPCKKHAFKIPKPRNKKKEVSLKLPLELN